MVKLIERAKPENYSVRRTITASAARINLRSREDLQDLSQQASQQIWQEKAWDHFDSIGEIAFGYGLVANVMSRIRLYPAVVVDPDAPPVALTDAATIERPPAESEGGATVKADNGVDPRLLVQARDIFHRAMGPSDVPGIMRSFALNVSVPGECYLAFIDSKWQIKSTSELKVDTSGVPKLRKTRSGQPRDLPKDTLIGRIWREHPQHSFEAWSVMKSLIDDCAELRLLGRVIRSNSRARLNAGIVYIPDEVVAGSQTVTDSPETEEDEEDAFEKEFYDMLVGPVEDEDNPNTVVPGLLRGPAGLGDEIKHIKFERAFDEWLVARADRTLERILQGLDMPKDVVTGLANVKYSNAIQIDESLYKAHVEPLALVIADAITDIIFRPLLRAAGWSADNANRMVVWYDPSEVTTRPDRAADAQSLYDAKELSGSALRQAYGYSDADKPSEEELATRLALANIPPPELLMVLFQKALPNVLKSLAAAQGAGDSLPSELQQTLAGTEVPTDTTLEPTVPGTPTPPGAP